VIEIIYICEVEPVRLNETFEKIITASALVNILDGFKKSKLKQLPHNLFMRDVLIQEDRILKAIDK